MLAPRPARRPSKQPASRRQAKRVRITRIGTTPAAKPVPHQSAGGVDLTFAKAWPRVRLANVKSQSPPETDICWRSYNSNIRKSACRGGVRMLELDHQLCRFHDTAGDPCRIVRQPTLTGDEQPWLPSGERGLFCRRPFTSVGYPHGPYYYGGDAAGPRRYDKACKTCRPRDDAACC